MARILLAGIPGVGKSSALDILESRLEVPVVNFGTAMLEHAHSEGYTGDRDGLRSVPAETADAWRDAAAAAIPRDAIIDGHVVVRTPAGLEDAMPAALRAPGYLAAVVVLECPAQEVQARRATRRRPGAAEPLADIKEHLAANRRVAKDIADAHGLALHFSDTSGVDPHEAAARVAACLPATFIRSGFK